MLATDTPGPTFTAIPADTPLPTNTPIPATATPEPTCVDHLDAYLILVQPFLDAFDAADRLANSTSREQLITPISQLQAQRLELAKIQASECLSDIHDLFLSYMDRRIEGHIETMEHNNQAVMDKLSEIRGGRYFSCALKNDNVCQSARDLTTEDVDIRAGDDTLATAPYFLREVEEAISTIRQGEKP